MYSKNTLKLIQELLVHIEFQKSWKKLFFEHHHKMKLCKVTCLLEWKDHQSKNKIEH